MLQVLKSIRQAARHAHEITVRFLDQPDKLSWQTIRASKWFDILNFYRTEHDFNLSYAPGRVLAEARSEY